jgi:hypothetical protein
MIIMSKAMFTRENYKSTLSIILLVKWNYKIYCISRATFVWINRDNNEIFWTILDYAYCIWFEDFIKPWAVLLLNYYKIISFITKWNILWKSVIVANILRLWWVIVIIQYGKGIKYYGYNNYCSTSNNSCANNLSSTTIDYCNCNNSRRLLYLQMVYKKKAF